MRQIKNFRWFGLAFAVVVLSGCSLFSQDNLSTPQMNPQARQNYLVNQSVWALTGRIGIITKEDSQSANIRWQTNGDSIELRIYGSLGATYALLTSSPGQAKIELSDDRVEYGSNAAELLWRTTGWYIPVDDIQQWILGLPTNAPSFNLNEQGLVADIAFADWQMTFQSYANFNGLQMPKKLRIQHPQVTLKFSIREWEVGTL